MITLCSLLESEQMCALGDKWPETWGRWSGNRGAGVLLDHGQVGAAGTVVNTGNVRTFSAFTAGHARASPVRGWGFGCRGAPASCCGLRIAAYLWVWVPKCGCTWGCWADHRTEQRSLVDLSLGLGGR